MTSIQSGTPGKNPEIPEVPNPAKEPEIKPTIVPENQPMPEEGPAYIPEEQPYDPNKPTDVPPPSH